MTNQQKLNERVKIKLAFHIGEVKTEIMFWDERKRTEEMNYKLDLKRYKSTIKKEIIKEIHEKQIAWYAEKIERLQREIESTYYLINEINKEMEQ